MPASHKVAMKLTAIEGNRQWLDGGAMFGHAPKTMWEKWTAVNPDNQIPLACRSLLIEVEGSRILCEVGVGDYMQPEMARRYGVEGGGHLLLQNLLQQGVQEKDIDFVILSHLHFDHAGGLVPAWPGMNESDWQMRFPNARFVVGLEQYERSLHPHARDKASYVPGLSKRLSESGRLILVGENGRTGTMLDSHIQYIFTSGHTPGLMHALISSGRKKIFFCSDIIPGQAWIHLPIVTAYDRYPELTVNEKSEILEQAVQEDWILFYTHDAEFIASKVLLSDKGRYQASQPSKKF